MYFEYHINSWNKIIKSLIFVFREEIKANEEPFEKERFLVSTLILYCQKLDPLHGSEDNEIDNCKNGSSSSINNAIPEKCVVYRKTDENDVFFAGVKKGSSGKKSGKKQKVTLLQNRNFITKS